MKERHPFRNVYISILNGALWDMGRGNSGICEIGLLIWHILNQAANSKNGRTCISWDIWWDISLQRRTFPFFAGTYSVIPFHSYSDVISSSYNGNTGNSTVYSSARLVTVKISPLHITDTYDGNPTVLVGFPHKGLIMWEAYPWHDVIMMMNRTPRHYTRHVSTENPPILTCYFLNPEIKLSNLRHALSHYSKGGGHCAIFPGLAVSHFLQDKQRAHSYL